ncbi:hypothetical protein [Thermocladium modestius]|uniref:hypothetical protein n=1 Tax=Thermocladium modestius TaxID=62609 RepID=UPI00166C5DC8|nr:hypothetical protein [Thermocladium modestius]
MHAGPRLGDVLMAQLPIAYTYDGHSFYPPLTGVYVEPPQFGYYCYSSTATSVGPGGTVVDYTCAPPNSWTGSVSAFIGSSPSLCRAGPSRSASPARTTTPPPAPSP